MSFNTLRIVLCGTLKLVLIRTLKVLLCKKLRRVLFEALKIVLCKALKNVVNAAPVASRHSARCIT